MRVREVPAYVHTMEAAMIAALADEGIDAEVRDGLTGVWAGESKIGSIGVHVSRGVTTHGFAVNVDGDLQPFEWIVPCGIDGVRMTSVLEGDRAHRRDAVLPQAGGVALRGGVRAAPAAGVGGAAGAGRLARVGPGMSVEHPTRSRANPGGARVLEMGEVAALRRAQAGLVQGAGARRRRATASCGG